MQNYAAQLEEEIPNAHLSLPALPSANIGKLQFFFNHRATIFVTKTKTGKQLKHLWELSDGVPSIATYYLRPFNADLCLMVTLLMFSWLRIQWEYPELIGVWDVFAKLVYLSWHSSGSLYSLLHSKGLQCLWSNYENMKSFNFLCHFLQNSKFNTETENPHLHTR